MSLKLNGATSGSIELDVPAAIGSDLNITIPATAGEVVVANTSGDVDLGGLTVSGSASDGSVNIDSSGRLLVGTSSSVDSSATVQIVGDDSIRHLAFKYTGTSGGAEQQIKWIDKRDQLNAVICNNLQNDNPGAAGAHLIFKTSTGGTVEERMRITSNGDFLVGDITPIGGNGHIFASSDYTGTYRTTTTAAAYVHAFASNISAPKSVKYAIYANGTAGSVSDINLKKNIEPARNYLDDLMKIEVVKYQWITDDDDQPKELGYIAQQVASVFPSMVTQDQFTNEDGETRTQYMLKKEVFVPMLLKAVQELKTALDDANTRIKTLEAQ